MLSKKVIAFLTGMPLVTASALANPAMRRKEQKKLLQIVLATVLLIFATAARAQNGPEVEVRGCVVDSGGKPFRNVNIQLSGLNYRGGAGYAGNNSIDTTNERGEFSLRMRAGTKDAPARAKLTGRYDVYVIRGWNGGGRPGGIDVWPDFQVENIGQPVDLRSKCIRFEYPFDVSGSVVLKEPLDVSPYPGLRLRITVGGAFSDLTTFIPRVGVTQEFNFGIDLSKLDHYVVNVHEPQPKGVYCEILEGKEGNGGDQATFLLESSYNTWTSKLLKVSCRKSVEKTAAEFHVHIIVSGKDSTMREGAAVGLKLTTKNPDGQYLEGPSGNGRVEVATAFPAGMSYTLSVDRQPTNEICKVTDGSGVTGKNAVPMGRKQVMEVKVECAPTEKTAEAAPVALLRRGGNAGATLFQQSISESEERERQARADAELLALATTNPRAYDNECMARSNRISASTQEARAVSVKNLYQGICSKASQARAQILEADSAIAVAARERERRQQADAAEAAQRAKEARELAAAVGQLLVTAAQISAASSTPDPVAAPAGGNRQQQAAFQAAPQARPAANASQGPVHNPANEAMQCITTFKEKNTSIQMKNNCSFYVSVSWPGGNWNIRPGGAYPSQLHQPFVLYACRYGGAGGAGMIRRGNAAICHD